MTLRHKNNSKFMKSALKGGLTSEIRQDINERKELSKSLMGRMNRRKGEKDSDDEVDSGDDEVVAPTTKSKQQPKEITRTDVDSIDPAMSMKDRIQAKLDLLGMSEQVDLKETGINGMKFMQSKLERDLDRKLKKSVSGGSDDYEQQEEEAQMTILENENRIAVHRPVRSNKAVLSAEQLASGHTQLDQVALSGGHKMRMSEQISIGKQQQSMKTENIQGGNKKQETKSIKVNKEIDEDNLDEQMENPWLEVTKSNKSGKNKEKKKQSQKVLVDMDNIVPINNNNINNSNNKRKNVDSIDKTTTTTTTDNNINNKLEDNNSNKKRKHPGMSLITSNKQKELLLEAFARDNVEDEFAKAKQELLEQELEKHEEENAPPKQLPGWGSWTGDGIKEKKVDEAKLKREREAKLKAIAQKRSDYKNSRVVIDEKSNISGVSKYLLSKTPMHYESKEQYESTLEVPLGKDWNTRTVYQKLIEPKLSVAAGTYIKPVTRADRNHVTHQINLNKKESNKVTSLKQTNNNNNNNNNKKQKSK
ncbi:U3 snoRNP protein [Heterostelium album PN500]|uniref:U3 snoRNP protein n=1 Tax=Heterostelium pallidum (strain ATCC 26659 / Pp 5 / PN500) TaxID=670386 RepID=D3BRY9_HETP5|nr:U3 snoRNP protein [Heterostelium album PN500]EFA75726.1 U3 snoRNP protein [Heterostelium album PN500]|eukprot:XP_020427860.1 U3 snoRNP protein [Heterostelium album PN500]